MFVFQESLSVVYTAYCPAQYTIYEPVIRLKGQVKTQLSQRPFSSKEAQSILLEPSQLKSLRPMECKTIQGILHEIGGAGVFVFLFARVRIIIIAFSEQKPLSFIDKLRGFLYNTENSCTTLCKTLRQKINHILLMIACFLSRMIKVYFNLWRFQKFFIIYNYSQNK